jgi:hypothetical protein
MTAVRGTVNRAASKPKVGFGSLSPVHPNYANGRKEYIAELFQMPKIGRFGESDRSRARKKLPLYVMSQIEYQRQVLAHAAAKYKQVPDGVVKR